jgi:hypothetical protein
MSNLNNEHGCTIHPDGTLKDASEINWDYDPDEVVPKITDTTMAASSSSAPAEIHPFFSGAHQSTRAIHPSACTIDPDNVMNASAKRKASSPAPNHCLARKIIAKPQSNGGNSNEDYSKPAQDTTDVEEIKGPQHGKYQSLKEMADTDYQVNIILQYIL